MTGTEPMMEFLRGHSMEMDHILKQASGSSGWEILVGTKFTSTGIFYCQVIITFEVITYIVLFHHLYIHNRNMENRQLGLSKETMKTRRRQNVVTFFGEFASFVIESIFGMLLQLMIVYHDKNDFNGFVPFL